MTVPSAWSVMRALSVHERKDALVLVVEPATSDADLSLELYAATERTGLLEQILGRPVVVEVGPLDG